MMLSIVIPTYNEKENVQPLAQGIEKAVGQKTDYEILFVDDSTDNTPEVLEELSKSNVHVRYIHRSEKSGLASAVVLGFEKAKGDIIAVMDADLQHPPSLLAEMLEAVKAGADVVLPSRYIKGGANEGLSFIRTLASKGAKYAARLLLPSMKHISDPMSGFFMFRSQVIEDTILNPIGWKILMEVLVMGTYQQVVEIPYGFEKRNAGESKLSFRVTVEYLLHIFSLAARGARERRRYDTALWVCAGIAMDILLFALLRRLGKLSFFWAAGAGMLAGGTAAMLGCLGFAGKSPVGSPPQKAWHYAAVLVSLLCFKAAAAFLFSLTGWSGAVVNGCASAAAMLCSFFWVAKPLLGKGRTAEITYRVWDAGKP